MTGTLRDARIGYAGYSPDFSAPGDRRRFCAYAAHRGLRFERAQLDRPYDVVLITHNADIPAWVARKKREGGRLTLLFELIDSYFTRTGLVHRLAKGSGRFALGIESRLSPDFLGTLRQACKAADAVICSTEEQWRSIAPLNGNVVISFDEFGDELGVPKRDYGAGERFRLVWEGQSTTLFSLASIAQALNALGDRIELHVVADPLIYRHFGHFGASPAMDSLRAIQCPMVFHPWERSTFTRQIVEADAALVPMDISDSMVLGKPENKLVMLWKLGMPVLAGWTPAYERAMASAGLEQLCRSESDWITRTEQLMAMAPGEREQVARRGRDYAEQAYSRENFVARFDAAFRAAGLAV